MLLWIVVVETLDFPDRDLPDRLRYRDQSIRPRQSHRQGGDISIPEQQHGVNRRKNERIFLSSAARPRWLGSSHLLDRYITRDFIYLSIFLLH